MTYRLQAPLDVLFHDAGSPLPPLPDQIKYTNTPGDTPADNLDLARLKLIADLDSGHSPIDTGSSTTYREWSGNGHGVTAPQAPPWLGLLQMRDRGQTGENWGDKLSIFAERWYSGDVLPNVLHSPRLWNAKTVAHPAYKGTFQRPCNIAPYEAHSIATLAMALGPTDPAYADLRLLTIGAMNWLMGIHYGVRGRYVLPPSDREWECGSFLPNFGSANVVQNVIGRHYWSEPSVIAGPGGALSQPDPADGGPDDPPWSYTPQNFGNTETYIRRDGAMLVACETATRLFHRLRVYEAEDGTLINLGDLPYPSIVSNNDAPTGRLNGGDSYTGLDVGEGLRFLLDPAQGTGAPDPSTDQRSYRILLRVGNASVGPKSARVKIVQGSSTIYDKTATVPQTGHVHEYVIVSLSDTVVLDNELVYQVDVTFPGGDVSFDRFEVKSRGK